MIINDSTSYVKAFYEQQREIDRDLDNMNNSEVRTLNLDDILIPKLLFTKVRDVKSPVRGHPTDAGIDFFVPEDFEKKRLIPGEDVLIPSGIKVIVPEGYAMIFKEKSGVAVKKKLTVGACVVDSDYRGEVHLHMFNNGTEEQFISPGDKIVQGVVVPVWLCVPKEISSTKYNEYETERGEGGFGSTGDR